MGRLKSHAFVERAVDPDDTRAKRVRVTPRGAALAPRAIAAVEEVDEEFLGPVPRRELLRLLNRLADPTGSLAR